MLRQDVSIMANQAVRLMNRTKDHKAGCYERSFYLGRTYAQETQVSQLRKGHRSRLDDGPYRRERAFAQDDEHLCQLLRDHDEQAH